MSPSDPFGSPSGDETGPGTVREPKRAVMEQWSFWSATPNPQRKSNHNYWTGGVNPGPGNRGSRVTPTSYQYKHENLFLRDPEIIDFADNRSGSPVGARGSEAKKHIATKACHGLAGGERMNLQNKKTPAEPAGDEAELHKEVNTTRTTTELNCTRLPTRQEPQS